MVLVNALERDLECHVGPRQIVNGEESIHSAQRGSELLGPSTSSMDQRMATCSVISGHRRLVLVLRRRTAHLCQDRIESDEEVREEMVPGHVQSADLS